MLWMIIILIDKHTIMNNFQYKEGDVVKLRLPHFHQRKFVNSTIEDAKIVKLETEIIHVETLASRKAYTMDYISFGLACNTSSPS